MVLCMHDQSQVIDPAIPARAPVLQPWRQRIGCVRCPGRIDQPVIWRPGILGAATGEPAENGHCHHGHADPGYPAHVDEGADNPLTEPLRAKPVDDGGRRREVAEQIVAHVSIQHHLRTASEPCLFERIVVQVQERAPRRPCKAC